MHPKTTYLLGAAFCFIAALVNFIAADPLVVWHIARIQWLLERPAAVSGFVVFLGVCLAGFGVMHLAKGHTPRGFYVLLADVGVLFAVANRYFALHQLQIMEAQIRQPEQLRAIWVSSSLVPLAFALFLLLAASRTRP